MAESTAPIPAMCLVCRSGNMLRVDGFDALPRITSDCREFRPGGELYVCERCGAVQKQPTPGWLQEIGEIYSAYASYYQSGGDEQIVFDKATGRPRRRSDVLVERLADTESLPSAGAVLDVGCGNGVTLSSIGTAFPDWSLNGYELGDGTLDRLKRLPKFGNLYTGSLVNVTRAFDLVTMIHSLEHFPSPREALDNLAPVVGPGRLFIEVCNVDQNPFDVVVADHLMHFSPDSLTNLLNRAGYEVESVATDWVPKEISLLARRAPAPRAVADASPGTGLPVYKRIAGYVKWLQDMTTVAEELVRGGRPFGIFGTSIAATWLASRLGPSVTFFVDEDESRVGKNHLGHPVYRPADVPRDSVVYIALAPSVAEIIAKKLAARAVRFAMPPALNVN